MRRLLISTLFLVTSLTTGCSEELNYHFNPCLSSDHPYNLGLTDVDPGCTDPPKTPGGGYSETEDELGIDPNYDPSNDFDGGDDNSYGY